MPYSLEQIYLHSGQFDKITSVTFHTGTESQRLYGDFITGEFIYTRQERIELENKIKLKPIPLTLGRVKFADNITKLTDFQRKELLEKGIPSDEIISIGQFRERDENKFIQESLRELPKPIDLKVDFSGIDADNLTLNLTRMRLQSGYKMIQSEKDGHNAVVLKRIDPTKKDTISLETFLLTQKQD